MAARARARKIGSREEVQLEHGRAVIEGLAEVAADEMAHEVPVLDRRRPVQAELLADGVQIGLARARLEQQHRRITGDPHEEEDGDREQEQREQRVAEQA